MAKAHTTAGQRTLDPSSEPHRCPHPVQSPRHPRGGCVAAPQLPTQRELNGCDHWAHDREAQTPLRFN